MPVCFLALLHPRLLPSRLILVWKRSSPSSHLLLIRLFSLECLQVHMLKSFTFLPFFFFLAISTTSFMISLIDSCHESCEVMHNIWTQFSAMIYCFGLGGFHGFFCNIDDIFSGVIHQEFYDVLSGFSSTASTILSIQYYV